MSSENLVSLLPGDFVGGNVLIVGTDGLDKDLLNAVSVKAGKLLVIDDGESNAILDGIQLNCEVDYVRKEQFDKTTTDGKVNNFSGCSLVLCNGVSDAEIASMCMSCLLPDGYVMLVTQCVQIHQSVVSKSDRTTYSVDSVFKSTPSLNDFGFVFVASRIIEKYENQRVLYSSVLKKVLQDPGQERRLDSLQHVLNDRTYTMKFIRIAKKIFSLEGDPGFLSIGGSEVTGECLKMLELQPDQRVLDAGCGAGGPLIFTAKKYKSHVIGVDISANMIDEATEATANLQDLNIELEVCDIERREFPDEYFDSIYSNDVILHIVRKQALFKKFFKWLKPGGKLMITDYCRTENDFSDIMQNYMIKRANVWFLITQSAYGKHLKEAGFVNVDVQDKHAIFRECCVKENIHLANIKDDLSKEFDKPFLDDWCDIWKMKIKLIDNKDMTWGVFYGEKSRNSETC